MAEAYCVRDKQKVEIQNPQQITMKNGKPATKGTCPICGNACSASAADRPDASSGPTGPNPSHQGSALEGPATRGGALDAYPAASAGTSFARRAGLSGGGRRIQSGR